MSIFVELCSSLLPCFVYFPKMKKFVFAAAPGVATSPIDGTTTRCVFRFVRSSVCGSFTPTGLLDDFNGQVSLESDKNTDNWCNEQLAPPRCFLDIGHSGETCKY